MPHIDRRALAIGALGVALTANAAAQTQPAAFPDADATDPVRLGWMQGTQPPADKRIAFEDGSYFQFPRTRWSFSNWRNFIRSVSVTRGSGPVSRLPVVLRNDLDAVGFTPLSASAPMTWRQSLDANYTDAILVLHRGRVAYERYFGVTTPETQHVAFSATKSFVGLIGQILIAEGKLDSSQSVASLVPELAQSGFADATVQQVADMTTAIRFDENYTAPQSEIRRYSEAGRFRPRPENYKGPEGYYAFAATVAKDGVHGERFTYRTINTDVLAWMIARVEGKPFQQVLADRIWSRLGMEADAAITIDGVGTPFAGGGLMARLRDMARFGETMRLGGIVNGRRAFPAGAVAEIAAGGDTSKFPTTTYPALRGASYRAQWWVTHNAHSAYMARGVHGQGIYIDPRAEMVIARFGSHPIAGNAANDPITLPAYQAMAEALMLGKRA